MSSIIINSHLPFFLTFNLIFLSHYKDKRDSSHEEGGITEGRSGIISSVSGTRLKEQNNKKPKTKNQKPKKSKITHMH